MGFFDFVHGKGRGPSREGWLLIFSHAINDRAGYLEDRSGRLYLRPVSLD